MAYNYTRYVKNTQCLVCIDITLDAPEFCACDIERLEIFVKKDIIATRKIPILFFVVSLKLSKKLP